VLTFNRWLRDNRPDDLTLTNTTETTSDSQFPERSRAHTGSLARATICWALSAWQGLDAKRIILLGEFNAALDLDDGSPSVGILQANGSNHRQPIARSSPTKTRLSGAFELLALLPTVISPPNSAGFSLTYHPLQAPTIPSQLSV
jgi:hypothetical protein